MNVEEIIEIIQDAHKENDPDTMDGIVHICQYICDKLDDTEEGDYWTEDAMIAIALAASRD